MTNEDEERKLRDQQAAAGRARWTKATPEAARSARAAAAHAINSPAGLARRLAAKWPTLDADERAAVIEALGPVWRARAEAAEAWADEAFDLASQHGLI